MEDNGDDAGSKLSRKGNVGAGVGTKWGVHDTIVSDDVHSMTLMFSPA